MTAAGFYSAMQANVELDLHGAARIPAVVNLPTAVQTTTLTIVVFISTL